jgi:ribose transport system substrate-binding protein
MTPIAGLGPHGERAAPPEHISLSETDAAAARAQRFKVAVVLHTTSSDWAKQELAGIDATLGRFGAAVVEVVDCGFRVAAQIRALNRLAREAPDAVISIPVGGTAVAEAHRGVSRAGIRLVLLDNGPTGLMPGSDYVSVVSADNFGLGAIAARLLSPHVPQHGKVGILSYQADFFATNEREIAFRKWMGSDRPDIRLKAVRFADVDLVAEPLNQFLDANVGMAGLFAVWDVPAAAAVTTLRRRSQYLPMTTTDLGNEAAIALARGDLLKGVAAQRAYDQGVTAATTTIASLVNRTPPSWVVLPGVAVTSENVVEAYRMIWHSPPPEALIQAGLALPP